MGALKESRVAVITGGAGGLGRVMAWALVEGGHRVVAMDNNAGLLEAMRGEFRDAVADGALHTVQGDVQVEADCNRAVAEGVERLGAMHMVINNAGWGPSNLRDDAERNQPTIEELTPEIWQKYIGINVMGAIQMTRAALPHMRAAGWGRIINNTTTFRTMLRIQPYGGVKAMLESITAVWAQELAGTGINVYVLAPGGPTDTAFVSDNSGWPREKMLRPQIMAAPVRWLVSPNSDGENARRITAAMWPIEAPPGERVDDAITDIGWPMLSAQAIYPT